MQRLILGFLASIAIVGAAWSQSSITITNPATGSGSPVYATSPTISGATLTGTTTIADVAGGDSSLGITGLAAAQGGDVAIAGGASSTAANTGGVVTATGGAGGATGAGGAVTVTGGAAGATSGTGGAVALVGGASPTSGNGGAVTLTGGAATTSGVGGAITITAGASAGGTNSGGSINLVPTAAVSTGAPGTVQVNGDANLICTSYFTGAALAANTDTAFFIATRPLLLVTASEVHAVAAGGASTATITKDTGTAAPGAGTSLHQSGSFDLNGTTNTVQNASITTTVATKTFAAGNRLSIKYANAVQASAGITLTACFAPL